MIVLEEVVIQLVADSQKLQKEVQAANDKLAQMEKQSETSKQAFTDLSKAAVAGMTVLGAAMGYSITQAMQAEKTNMRLFNSLKNVGRGTQETFNEVDKLATKLEYMAGVGDEEVKEAFAQMLNITQDYEQSLKGIEIAMDMSAATGMDLRSSVRGIGMALEGNTGMLARYGIKLKEGAAALEVLEEVNKRFQGSAAAMGQTLDGQLNILKARLSDLGEVIGTKLIPETSEFLKMLEKSLSFWEDLAKTDGFESVIVGARKALTWYTDVGLPTMMLGVIELQKTAKTMWSSLFSGRGLIDGAKQVKQNLFEFGNSVKYLQQSWSESNMSLEEHKKLVDESAKSYLKLGESGKQAVQEVTEALTVFDEIFIDFAGEELLNNLTEQTKELDAVLQDTVDSFTSGFAVLGQTLVETEGKMGEAWKQVAKTFLGSIIDAFMVRVSAQMALYTAQLFDPVTTASAAAGLAVSGAQLTALSALKTGLTMFADGGVVNKATAGIFGEAGPEAVMPLASITPLIRDAITNNTSTMGDTNIYIQPQKIDPNTDWNIHARNIKKALQKDAMQNGYFSLA